MRKQVKTKKIKGVPQEKEEDVELIKKWKHLKKKIKETLSNQVDNITNNLGKIKRKYL